MISVGLSGHKSANKLIDWLDGSFFTSDKGGGTSFYTSLFAQKEQHKNKQ